MPNTEFTNTVSRSLTDIIGEQLSVLSYGAVGDGTTDDAPAINKAITSLIALGGRAIYFPGGRTYLVKSPILIPTGISRITLYGDGTSSVIKRGANIAAGKGVLDIKGSNVAVYDLRFDGNVTTSTGLLYNTDFTTAHGNDPMAPSLTTNSSVWVHGGVSNITFRGCSFYHTGGYSLLFDATTGDIGYTKVIECVFENCRPHLFGSTAGDATYGSWTGGIHYQGDGASYAVHDATVRGCTFRRVTGNCLWTHLYGFGKLHSNIRFSNNHFEDCGLDGILIGGVVGGSVDGNTFRRVGYVTNDDTSASYPKWLQNLNATGLDTAGLVRGVNYTGNTFVSINGGCMDLDGYAEGNISGNTCIIPLSTDPEYAEDSIATFGPGGTGANWTYGAQVSNTNNLAAAGIAVNVTGNTFSNMGGGAVRLYASRGCSITTNTVSHPANANVAPFILGNIGAGDYQRSYNNVVTDNFVTYNPSTPVAAVQENSQIAAFASTDKNWISDNKLFGNCYEFYKDPTTLSVTAKVMSSSMSHLTAASETVSQRENLYTRWYSNVAGTSTSIMTLIDAGTINNVAASGGPLLNVSKGAGLGGILSTGGRTTSLVDDCVITGKLYADGFLAITNSSYLDSEANRFPATMFLIRYDSTNKVPQMSTSVSNGQRVWTNWVSAALPGGSDKQVQFNDGGVLAGAAPLTWDKTAKALTIAGTSATPSLVLSSGFAQSTEGFYTPSTASTAIQAPSGGVTALSLVAIRNDASDAITISRTAAVAQQYGFSIDANGSLVLSDATAASKRWTLTSVGTIQIGGSNTQIDQSGNISVAGTISATAGFNSPSSTAANAIQAPSGGVTAKYLVTSESIFGAAVAAPSTSAANQGKLHFNSTANKWQYSENGSAWANCFGGAVSSALPLTQHGTYYAGIVTEVSTSLIEMGVNDGRFDTASGTQDNTAQGGFLRMDARSGSPLLDLYARQANNTAASSVLEVQSNGTMTLRGALVVTLGNLQIDASGNLSAVGTITSTSGGFNVTGNTTNNSIQTSGGVSALRLVATESVFGIATAAPALSGTGQGKLHFNSTANKWQYSENGSGWVNCFGTATVAGSDKQLQFNSSGVLSASANLTWDNAAKLLTVTGATGTPSIATATSFIQSAEGFYTPSGSSTAINVPNGQVSALSFYSARNDGSPSIVLARTAATGRQYGLGIDSNGSLFISDMTANAGRLALTSSGTLQLGGTNFQADQTGAVSAAGVFTSTGSTGGINVTANAQNNSIQTVGGVTALRLVATESIYGTAVAAPALSGANQGKLHFNSTANKWQYSENGSAWENCFSPSSSGTLPVTQHGTYYAGIVTEVSTSLIEMGVNDGRFDTATGTQDNTTQGGFLRVDARAGAPLFSFYTRAAGGTGVGSVFEIQSDGSHFIHGPLQVTVGNFQVNGSGAVSAAGVISSTGASGGFNVTGNTQNNSIQTVGGVTALRLVATESIYGNAVAAPAASGLGQGKLHFNSSVNKWQYSENGSGWFNCFGAAAAGGANQQVQVNEGGVLGGYSTLTYDGTFLYSNTLRLKGSDSYQVYESASGSSLRVATANGSVILCPSLIDVLAASASGVTIGTGPFQVDASGNMTAAGEITSNGSSGGVNITAQTAWNGLQTSSGARIGKPYLYVGFSSGFDLNTNPYSGYGYAYNPGSSVVQIQADGQPASVVVDSYGYSPAFRGRAAGGSLSSPYGPPAGATLFALTGHGFIPGLSGGFPTSSNARIVFQAAENFQGSGGVATNCGTQISFGTTPNGSATLYSRLLIANDGTIQIANSSGTMASGFRYNSGTAKLQFSHDLTNWSDLGSGSGGVTSLAAGTGIGLSGSTGSITITNTGVTSLIASTGVTLSGTSGVVSVSIGQNVSSSSSVTFANVTSSGVVQAGATGASITFQNTNSNFSVDGNGNISCAGHVSAFGSVSATIFDIQGGYFGQTVSVTLPAGSSVTTLYFKGGILYATA